MLTKVLVANRGEIAARIVRTCAELGIASVAIHSDPDEKALHVRLADEAVRLPGAGAAETYLDLSAVLAAARETGADAVHPGYGFLSENPEFAAAVEQAGLVFVGPPAQAIAALGDKMSARTLAQRADVPVVPGIQPRDLTGDDVRWLGATSGWPVVVKAARGGGGRGMRVIWDPGETEEQLASARAEARAAFGDGTLYAERYLENSRHIEVQVFADGHGHVAWLGDRDCSVQRRHQKLVEEAPAPGLDASLRAEMGEAAARLAGSVGYRGAGTVEFLVEDGRFFFLEMNTRIQVEHPVTEAVLGVDLVREQLLVAGGAPLSVPVSGPPARGHAVECRINAEDPGRDFAPAPGPLRQLQVPWLPGVRVDAGYEPGDEILPHYDSLVAKVITWGPTRDIALHRMRAALAGTVIDGPPTTVPAAAAVVSHTDFLAGGVSTHWFERVVHPTLRPQPLPRPEAPADAGPEADGVWIAGRFHRLPRLAPGASTGTAAENRRRTGGRVAPSPTGAAPTDERQLTSPMHGTVVAVAVAEGDVVAAGQVVATIEAMKMENRVTASNGGVVEAVLVRPGETVSAGAVLVRLAPATPPRSGETEEER